MALDSARLTGPISKPGRTLTIRAEFVYYDSADGVDGNGVPNLPLHYKEFLFPPDWSNANMQNAVRVEGALARTAQTRAAALVTNFPAASTVISIP